MLLSDFLQASGEADGDESGHDSETERRFLGGADLGLTHKYLAKKARMAEQKKKAKVDIDRRASKNRKIRYVVHEKLLNFMTSMQVNLQKVEGRDALVGNLFGVKNSGSSMPEIGKKRKAKQSVTIGESDDDIALIWHNQN